MALFFDILFLILLVLLIWFFLGCIAVWLHYADNVQDGMSKIGKAIYDFFHSDDGSSGAMAQIPDYQFEPLTTELKQYFSALVLMSAMANSDMQTIVYRQNDCSIGIDVIEIIYRKFLQKALNLNINAPLYVYVDMDNEYLYLYASVSEKGRQQIEQARNNRRSREIFVDKDIFE